MVKLSTGAGNEDRSVVTQSEWIAARTELLRKEKEFTRLRDELNRQRHALPWERIEKEYVFDGPRGKRRLADLFDGRSQLIIYHFMFGPEWTEGCPSCSFLADHIDGTLVHLNHHDVTLLAVSRAPLSKIEAFKKRMGWHFPWVSSFGSDFNFDYHVSATKEELGKGEMYYNYRQFKSRGEEQPGISVFYQDQKDNNIYHTYSSYARGGDLLIGTYNYLDLAPKGRNEINPEHLEWVRHHDKYDD
ncbi:MAG TPA: thioredoxin family protein [Candidatus Saccharimonadales bacterium]|nr:thioredoxin family protein [Candidatus Saccharimonadales bacterium]